MEHHFKPLQKEPKQFLKEYKKDMDLIRQGTPLDTNIIYKRKIYGFEEWKVEYTAEVLDTMPEPAGCKVPAYVLIPGDKSKAPFPAMVCFNQCFCDCEIGKEAVVGKIFERVDQAYGFELVQQGFAVIAPDAMNCGERNIPAIRKEGDRIMSSSCGSQFKKHIGKTWGEKIILDGMRAIDLLESLDFVDADRIGAIGHSMGAHQTFITMAVDSRIKAGVLSGFDGTVHGLFDDYNEGLAYLAPRFLMQLQGSYDGLPQAIEKIKGAHNFARKAYERANAQRNLILRMFPCGHYFLDEFKWEAYARLKQYFNIAAKKGRISLKAVLKKAREDTWWAWNKDENLFPAINTEETHLVEANNDSLEEAFESIFIPLCQKIPCGSALKVNVKEDEKHVYAICSILNGNSDVKVGHEYLIRKAESRFVENNSSLEKGQTNTGLKWTVRLQKGNYKKTS